MTTFYDIHAEDFSRSRFRIWPSVHKFLNGLPIGSRVLDIGCGNGKNMYNRSNLEMIGLENSQQLCEICTNRGLNVVQGDARALPFEQETFDAIIVIAVIHHIHPEEHELVLNEIQRVLKPGGKCLITNWAEEQPEAARRTFHTGLNWVVWKGKESNPLPYWIMNRALAENFKKTVPEGLICERFEWDAGNWEFYINKSIC
jgi:SAM-dependent methyltransferase